MKALTLRQPWASLVAVGAKTVETRSWSTKYRGPLAIHAGKVKVCVTEGAPWGPLLADPGGGALLRDDVRPLPLGAIVATAELVDCVPILPADAPGDVDHIFPIGKRLVHWPAARGWGDNVRDITDQLPFGDFTPGRWAWLLDYIRPTTESCPACRGGGLQLAFEDSDQPSRWGGTTHPCSICDGVGHCDPIPAKGRQGLWRWEP